MITRFRFLLSFVPKFAFRSGLNFQHCGYTTIARPAAAQPPTVRELVDGQENMICSEHPSLAISKKEDDADIRHNYRPFLLQDDTAEDWVSTLELTTALDMAAKELQVSHNRLKVLVLYGSLRRRSYSRLVALEASRILFRLGCDVRVFNPEGLPVKNDIEHGHPKVQELRELSKWSDGHIWVSPEQHGNLVSSISPPQKVLNFLSLTTFRPPCSKIKLTGSRLRQGVFVPRKAGPLLLCRCAVDRNHSTPSTPYVFSAGGCACLLSQISRLPPKHIPISLTRVNRETRDLYLVVIETGWWIAWRSL